MASLVFICKFAFYNNLYIVEIFKYLYFLRENSSSNGIYIELTINTTFNRFSKYLEVMVIV